jgi:hypothetical protein
MARRTRGRRYEKRTSTILYVDNASGEERLAASVIAQAVHELRLPSRGRDARSFLTVENEDLRFWCDMAGLDVSALCRKAAAIGG